MILKLSKEQRENISIWFYFNIESRFDKIMFAIRRWWYIHNLPTPDSIAQWYADTHIHDKYSYYTSRVILAPVIDLKLNVIVNTKHGIGRVKLIYKQRVEVEMLALSTKSKRFRKSFNINDLTQLVVYHAPSHQFILLSPRDYVYVVKENQEVQYRITNRKLATLSPSYKRETEYIKVFNENRGGSIILRSLLKKGFVIQRQ
jgi:hypothetical protein